ncbi:hypothetical protein [Aquimarina intermedia]|uniref:Subunit length determinant protein n=1 Tax=Aquimarina intermedia TaxID=350814 RepID=A0A5S5CFU7_9FLAO|nr:hypothetical protein [Aquimarina intermedia]TYP76883.1 hypothetical protein BD809_10128 [Aquimarina intermedia]
MNQTQSNDEIDLGQLFKMIGTFFKRVIRLFIQMLLFFKKKAILLISLFVVGAVAGYFIDNYGETKFEYVQQIVLEPNYESTKFLYDFIEDFKENVVKDEENLKKIGITIEQVENIKEITLEPVVQATAVLDHLQERYNGKDFFKEIMEAYDEEDLQEDRYLEFYKYHRLTFVFKSAGSLNEKFSSTVLDYFKSNTYFKEVANLKIRQYKNHLSQSEASLTFVNEYLKALNNTSSQHTNQQTVVVAEEGKAVTVASLLEQKEELLENISDLERRILLGEQVFATVNYGDIIQQKKSLDKRVLFLLPFVLCGIVIGVYFLKFLFERMNNFANQPD